MVYWKALFAERNADILGGLATVRLPQALAGQIGDYRSFGALADARQIDDRTVEFTTRGPLPPGQELEVQVDFPNDSFPSFSLPWKYLLIALAAVAGLGLLALLIVKAKGARAAIPSSPFDAGPPFDGGGAYSPVTPPRTPQTDRQNPLTALVRTEAGRWLISAGIALVVITFFIGGFLWSWNYIIATLAGIGILPLVALLIIEDRKSAVMFPDRKERREYWMEFAESDRLGYMFSVAGLSINGIIILVGVIIGALTLWGVTLGFLLLYGVCMVLFLIFGPDDV